MLLALGVSERDAMRFEEARTVALEFDGDIPGQGIFGDDVRRVVRGLALHEVPVAESELLVRIKGSIRYSYRRWNGATSTDGGRVVTTRIRAEGRIVARLAHGGPEVKAEFFCDSGMPLAPALVESPDDISPLPSVEEVSACLAKNVNDLLSPVLQREQRPDAGGDLLAASKRPGR